MIISYFLSAFKKIVPGLYNPHHQLIFISQVSDLEFKDWGSNPPKLRSKKKKPKHRRTTKKNPSCIVHLNFSYNTHTFNLVRGEEINFVSGIRKHVSQLVCINFRVQRKFQNSRGRSLPFPP